MEEEARKRIQVLTLRLRVPQFQSIICLMVDLEAGEGAGIPEVGAEDTAAGKGTLNLRN